MQLREASSAALEAWIAPLNWARNGYEDMRRFYRFLSQYQKDHGSVILPDLRQTIISAARAKGHPIGKEQEKVVENLTALAYKILDFLEETGR